jgi:DNA-binding CsgD family transcriptional regulator
MRPAFDVVRQTPGRCPPLCGKPVELLGGVERAAAVIRERAGAAFDPEIAGCFADNAAEILTPDREGSAWEEMLACEPYPRLSLQGDAIDRALAAMGAFADLVSPSFVGHSAAVADLAEAAAERCRLGVPERGVIRRAALVHDLGRVAVHARAWNRPGPLSADEWEQVRLHPYYTERVLSRSRFLAALAPIAGAHHERLDGSGYHRAATGAVLTPGARLLAAADAYRAMTAPRPHREPLAPERAADVLGEETRHGRLDADAVAAVLEAAGQSAPRIERPCGLTEREAEVIGLLACGLHTKQVARALGISVKTADRHIQNAYAKIGVSTRAAAALFAMEHGLAAWGELPIAHTANRT